MGAWDLASATTCRAGIYLCLVFYVGGKVLLYVYLVERMASIQEEEERIKMPLFWLGLAAVGLGFGTIAIVAFLFPVVDISPVDGRCRIGLPLKVTIPLLSYDIVLNFGLCGVFFRTCQKHTGTTRTRGLWQRVFSDLPFVHPTLIASTPPLRLEILAYRCLMGACAIVIPTTANLVILFRIHGREQGWLCFTICTIDSKSLLHPTSSCFKSLTLTSHLASHNHPLGLVRYRNPSRRTRSTRIGASRGKPPETIRTSCEEGGAPSTAAARPPASGPSISLGPSPPLLPTSKSFLLAVRIPASASARWPRNWRRGDRAHTHEP